MGVVVDMHSEYGATLAERGGREIVSDYGRPRRAASAVRNGVGVIEMGYGIVIVEGDDRIDFVDNAVSNRVPNADGQGCYALLLDPQGGITTDLYVHNAGGRVLCFVPPGCARSLADEWSSKVFIQDVTVRAATNEFGVFGVHGPQSTEKVASVMNGAAAPEQPLTFVRGSMHDSGVTVIATDAPVGEEGYEVVCATSDAPQVFETLITRGMNAPPFGYRTWEALTAEAGTPLFETELEGRIPNVLGLRNALDFQKGCYVGQEVVSKVENRGRPSQRLVGLRPEALPEQGAAVFDGNSAVGEVTRAVDSPTLEVPIALALLDFDVGTESVTVRVDAGEVPAEVKTLPFVEGSARSARIPSYPPAESN